MTAKIGLIARSDKSGLGFQTRELYKLLKPHKTLVVDSSPFNGRRQYFEWYDKPQISRGIPNNSQIIDFLKDLNVVITCEVPYNINLYRLAKRRGIKTILQPNAELNPHFRNRHLEKPDYFFLPSSWYEEEYKRLGVPYFVIKPPVVQPRKKTMVKKSPGELKVLHFGGRRAAHDRNGTDIVRSLPKIEGVWIDVHDQSIDEIEDQRDLYEKGYHLVLIPRRYGGLCLPMLESLSYGVPVIMPNCPPNNSELPTEWLVKADNGKTFMSKRKVNSYNADPSSIINMLKTWRYMDQEQYDIQRSKADILYQSHQSQLKKWMVKIEEIALENLEILV